MVEDNLGDAELVRDLLAEGMPRVGRIDHVETSAMALAHFGTLRPDVVLLDLRLPDSSGVDAVCALRSRARRCRSWC